ncbi:MAG TPA: hypothetical protein VIL49_06220, partial [Capillimicrobium sp.]
YAYFSHGGRAVDEELAALQADPGQTEAPSGDGQAVGRLHPDAPVLAGEPARLWVNATKLHLFDGSTGESLTAGGPVAGHAAGVPATGA